MERPVRASVFVLCALPFVWLAYGAVYGGLGPDPGEALMHSTGEWSLRMLAVTLLISPLRVWTGKPWVIKLRRMLGLYAFFYATIHFTLFLQFYTGWAGATLLQELVERPYVSAGFAAWFIMLPLAITSTRGMRRRLGQRWTKLHRQIYVAAIIACIHLLWQARSDIGEPLAYLLVFALLLVWRARRALKANSSLKPGKV